MDRAEPGPIPKLTSLSNGPLSNKVTEQQPRATTDLAVRSAVESGRSNAAPHDESQEHRSHFDD
jgi:hypothetical protein